MARPEKDPRPAGLVLDDHLASRIEDLSALADDILAKAGVSRQKRKKLAAITRTGNQAEIDRFYKELEDEISNQGTDLPHRRAGGDD